jgi:hypothetical protein
MDVTQALTQDFGSLVKPYRRLVAHALLAYFPKTIFNSVLCPVAKSHNTHNS